MRHMVHSARVGLCYLDRELRYLQINGFLAAINGRTPKEHLGRRISEVLPKIAAAGAEMELRGVLESGAPVFKGSVAAETPAHPGEVRTYSHDYHAIRADGGEIIGVTCRVVDVTDGDETGT